MSKKYLLILSGIIMASALSGCGQKKTPETESSAVAPSGTAEEDVDPDALSDSPETAEELDPITPSDYLIKDVSEYVTLGDLNGLEVTQYSYEITDDMVQERILSELEAYGEEVEVNRAAAEGDIIYADITSTIHGEPDTAFTESTYMTLGDEEYSADFDKKLLGASSGDTLKFTCSFDNDTWMDEWANKSVDFEVTITSVCEMDIPEYTEEYVAENTDFSNKSEYEDYTRELLLSEYDEAAYNDTIEALFQAAINESKFSGYPEDLYASCKEEVLSLYSAFLGDTDEQAIYEAFDLSPDDISTEVLSAVNRRLLVSAICETNDVEVTEEAYAEFVNDYAGFYGYDSAVQFEADYTRESLVWALYENEAAAILYDAAKISLVPYDEEFSFDDENIEEIPDSDNSSETESEVIEEFSLDE
ncbi:MAG: hypothetical protein Q4C61_10100 [Lachnospiraceae bacterium]|nr:hypothetical protein [Lachnospiraceae bacterium]